MTRIYLYIYFDPPPNTKQNGCEIALVKNYSLQNNN